MAELIRTNDLALIAVVEALLNGEEIPCHVADRHASVIDGSLRFVQMRVLVPDDRADEARELIRDAELGEWLRDAVRRAAYRRPMGDVVAFPSRPAPEAPKAEPLWREAVGRELREERQSAERTLADVARDAGVSTQYLSEVERGLKEPSSEVLGAVAGALGLRLVDLTSRVSRRLTSITGPVCLAA